MTMSGRCTRWALLNLVLLAVAGCGSSKYQPVTGQIVFADGTPAAGLEGGQIVFELAAASGNVPTATGSIDAEGRFQLGTVKPGDGATAGLNKVLISPPEATGDVPLPPVIHGKYKQFATSGLEYNVQPGPNEFKITVDRPASK
jgi:hypothetical protein